MLFTFQLSHNKIIQLYHRSGYKVMKTKQLKKHFTRQILTSDEIWLIVVPGALLKNLRYPASSSIIEIGIIEKKGTI